MKCNNKCKNCNIKLRTLENDKRYGWIYSYYCPLIHCEVGIEGRSGKFMLPSGKVIKGFYQTKK